MVVVHGDEFLQSLQDLFDEAGEHGRDPQAHFDLFKEPLIQYILARQYMTAAKARASLDLCFSDRRRPETVVQLPPTTLKLDETGAATLKGASSGNEFIGLLRVLIDESVAARGFKRKRRTKAEMRAMKEEQAQMKIQGTTRREIESEQKARMSMMAKDLKSMKSTPAKKVKKELGLHLPTFIPPSTPLQFSAKRQKVEVDVPMASIEKHEDVEIEPPKQEHENFFWYRASSLGTVQTEMLGNFLDEHAFKDQAKAAEDEERMGSPELGEYEPAIQTCKEEDVDMVDDAGAPIGEDNKVTAGSSSFDPEHDSEQFVDSRMEFEDDNHSSSSLSDEEMDISEETTPETQSEEMPADSLLLLKSAISHLSEEIAPIPPATWDAYETKLFQLCADHNLFTLPFKERLNKMVRIIYLDEEEEAISTEDWSRMAGVVKICAFLAQTTGPALEAMEQRMVNGWVIGRLRDIKFLVCKERIFGLTAESEVE